MRVRTACVDGHNTVFAASRAKRNIILDELGLDFADSDFPDSGVYLGEGIRVWDPVRQAFRTMTKNEYSACMQKLFDPDNYLKYMEPMQLAEDVLVELKEQYDEIVLVTTARGVIRDVVEELVLRYDLPIRNVIATHGDKENAKRECYANSDLAIDNEPQYLTGLDKFNTHGVLLLPAEGETGWRAARTATSAFHDRLPTAFGWVGVMEAALPTQLAA